MRSDESVIRWWPFTPKTATKGLVGKHSILAIRADGKGYYGRVIAITPEYLELENGSQKQILRFFDSPTTFAIVDPPKYAAPRLAERELFGKDTINGQRP